VKELVEHGGLVAMERVKALRGLDVMLDGADAVPKNPMALTLKCHA
jgi:ribose 5-phosphate isomerase